MLREYAAKRDFEVTPEPKPETQPQSGALTFVVQKHAATNLHYDFRLELDGVLLSWAVPKGPTMNPAEKRLAVHTEDHPFAYGGFEGMIPQGEYGGGQVIIWDRGTYHTEKAPADRASQEVELRLQMERGKVEITLEGEKLRGGFVLLQTKGKQWLFMKRQDAFATEKDILLEDRSVVTGQRIGGVADTNRPSRMPDVKPMLLTDLERPFSDPKWIFELKLDGIRALAFVDRKFVQIVTRNGNDVTSRFPKIVDQLAELNLKETLLDGELVTFDERGLPNFQALAQPFQAGRVINADFILFDLLQLEDKDLRRNSWSSRRAALENLNVKGDRLRLVDVFPEEGQLLFEKATEMGFEGIVGKRKDSRYESGIRSPNWVKVKGYLSEEFLVGGFTKGSGARSASFGGLALGQMTEKGLEFVGKVGGGFNDTMLDEVYAKLEALKTKESPFNGEVPVPHVQWVQPQMVVEVRFTGWTNEKRLRFPIFMRMRPDLPAVHPGGGSKPVSEFLGAKGEKRVSIEGHDIRFSSLDKEMWPGVAKGELLDYYLSISETLLKYLKNRPLSFVRCPDGVNGERFFQKHYDKGKPEFVETVTIHSESNERARDFVMCNNLPTLMWLGQIGTLELNPWDSRVDVPDGAPASDSDFGSSHEALEESILNRPDYLVLDLDPYFGGKAPGWRQAEWLRLVEVAFVLRDLLRSSGLHCYPKSSGKSGLHLYLPVARDYSYDEIRAAARAIGEIAYSKLGKKVTLEWNIKKRPEGVFIDVNQNVRGKTMAAPYSPRAASVPSVSMPLLWDELERVDPTKFTMKAAMERLAVKGDLWAETLGNSQRLG